MKEKRIVIKTVEDITAFYKILPKLIRFHSKERLILNVSNQIDQKRKLELERVETAFNIKKNG